MSIFFLGGIGGAYLSASMNDFLGRRAPLLAAAALVTLTALLGMTTTWYPWLLCVRTTYGVASGMNNASLVRACPWVDTAHEQLHLPLRARP